MDSSASRLETLAGLTAKLREGWTLMQQTCPICLTPLIRNKENQIWCEKCAMFCVSEPSLSSSALSSSSSSSSSASSATQSTSSSSSPSPVHDPEIAALLEKNDREAAAAQHEAALVAASQSKPTDPSKQSVLSSPVATSVDEDEDWKPPTPGERARIDAHMKYLDEVSSKMGQKMLQGWAMLNITCPECDVRFLSLPS